MWNAGESIRRSGGRLALLAAMALTAGLLGCGTESRERLAADLGVELLPVPSPDLSRSEVAVRKQIEIGRSSLDGLLETTGTRVGDLADAYGALGMLYHVYQLDEAAAPCYRNARSLDPSEPRWSYYLGMLFQRGGDLEAAAGEYERVLAELPDDLPTLLRLGDIHLRMDRVEEALDLYRRALELAPGSAAAHYGLGRAAARSGQNDLAVTELERALELQPQATRIHYQLASVLRAAGQMERAEGHLARQGPVEVGYADPRQRELLLLARSTAARVDRAARLTSEGRLEEAIRQYRAALGDDPDSLEARRGLASVLALSGEMEEAERIYHDLVADFPDDGAVHQRLGRVLESRGKLAEAIAAYRTARRLSPELGGLNRDLGRALHLGGQHEASIAEYGKAIEESPQDRWLTYERALVLAAAERADEAASELSDVIREDPGDLDFRIAAARALGAMGRFEEMETQCRAVLDSVDATPEQKARASHNLATARLQAGDLAGAERLFGQAASWDPGLREARIGWGRTLAAMGRHPRAAEEFGAAVLLEPSDPVARLAEVDELLTAGLEGYARARLEEAVEALPGDPRPLHRLSRLLATASDDSVREGRLALELAQKLLEETRSAVHAETVAMALAEVGRFDEAIRLQRTLIAQAEVEADSRYVDRLRENLRRYEKGEPSRGS